MKVGQFATQLKYPLMAACMIVCFSPASALAQGDHADMKAADSRPQTATEKDKATALVKEVRDATARFRDVTVAESEDYVLKFGCVSGSDFGAMGVHFVNFDLVGDGTINIKYPELLVYEPAKNGHLNLVAADYLVDSGTLGRAQPGPTGAQRTAVPPVRRPQSLRPRPVLHAARLGVEGQPQRDVHELES